MERACKEADMTPQQMIPKKFFKKIKYKNTIQFKKLQKDIIIIPLEMNVLNIFNVTGWDIDIINYVSLSMGCVQLHAFKKGIGPQSAG